MPSKVFVILTTIVSTILSYVIYVLFQRYKKNNPSQDSDGGEVYPNLNGYITDVIAVAYDRPSDVSDKAFQ